MIDLHTRLFSNVNHCTLMTRNELGVAPEFALDHEEADTKLVALIHNADLSSAHSAMVDMFLFHQCEDIRILIDYCTGKSRKLLDISLSGLRLTQRQALVGLHAFSGNDYVSSFCR